MSTIFNVPTLSVKDQFQSFDTDLSLLSSNVGIGKIMNNRLRSLLEFKIENVLLQEGIKINYNKRDIRYLAKVITLALVTENISSRDIQLAMLEDFTIKTEAVPFNETTEVENTAYITTYKDYNKEGEVIYSELESMDDLFFLPFSYIKLAKNLDLIHVDEYNRVQCNSAVICLNSTEVADIVKVYPPINTNSYSLSNLNNIYTITSYIASKDKENAQDTTSLILNNPESPYNRTLFKNTVFEDFLIKVNSQQLILNTAMAKFSINERLYQIQPTGGNLGNALKTTFTLESRFLNTCELIVKRSTNNEGCVPAFYLTHSFDKRGRLYATRYELSYQGPSWQKACINFNLNSFYKPTKPLHREQEINLFADFSISEYYLINIGNFLGFDKETYQTRIEKAKEFLTKATEWLKPKEKPETSDDDVAEILADMTNYFGNSDYQYDDEYQLISCLQQYIKNNDTYVLNNVQNVDTFSNIVWFDATSSGPQIIAALSGDTQLLQQVGISLDPEKALDQRYDIYLKFLETVYTEVINKPVTELISSLSELTTEQVTSHKGITLNSLILQLKELVLTEFELKTAVKPYRKLGKQLIMKTCYGSRKALEEFAVEFSKVLLENVTLATDMFRTLLEHVKNAKLEQLNTLYTNLIDNVYSNVADINKFQETVETIFSTSLFQPLYSYVNMFRNAWINPLNKIEYTAPDGFEVSYAIRNKVNILSSFAKPYFDKYDLNYDSLIRENRSVNLSGSNSLYEGKNNLRVNANSVELAANFTHSIDAAILRSVIYAVKSLGEYNKLLQGASHMMKCSMLNPYEFKPYPESKRSIFPRKILTAVDNLNQGAMICLQTILPMLENPVSFKLIKDYDTLVRIKQFIDMLIIKDDLEYVYKYGKIANIVSVHDCFGVPPFLVGYVHALYNFFLGELYSGKVLLFMLRSFNEKTYKSLRLSSKSQSNNVDIDNILLNFVDFLEIAEKRKANNDIRGLILKAPYTLS